METNGVLVDSVPPYHNPDDFSNPRFLQTPDDSNQLLFPVDLLDIDSRGKNQSSITRAFGNLETTKC